MNIIEDTNVQKIDLKTVKPDQYNLAAVFWNKKNKTIFCRNNFYIYNSMNAEVKNWKERTELLVGKTESDALAAASVLIVGLGGVGSYAAEIGRAHV